MLLKRRSGLLLHSLADDSGMERIQEASMSQSITLSTSNTSPEFVFAYADMISVRPAIIPTGSVTGSLGYNPWKAALKKAVQNYIRNQIEFEHKLPIGVHVLKTGNPKNIGIGGSGYDIYFENVAKFPDEVPPFHLETGSAKFDDHWSLETDAGLGYFTGSYQDMLPSSERSRLLLRHPFFIGRYDYTATELYRVSEHLHLPKAVQKYLLNLIINFDRAHGFPPNLVLIYKLLKVIEKPSDLAITLIEAIEALQQEVMGSENGVIPTYDWRPVIHDLKLEGGLLQTVRILPDADDWQNWLDESKNTYLPEVRSLQYVHTIVTDNYWAQPSLEELNKPANKPDRFTAIKSVKDLSPIAIFLIPWLFFCVIFYGFIIFASTASK